MKLRELVLHNFRLKLISVVMAALIWEAINVYDKGGVPWPFNTFVTTNSPAHP